jgi:hypothetical protein
MESDVKDIDLELSGRYTFALLRLAGGVYK